MVVNKVCEVRKYTFFRRVLVHDKEIGKNKPTVEFHIPKEEWERGGKSPIFRSINSHEILHFHEPWHHKVRYILDDPKLLKDVKNGKIDHVFNKENDNDSEFEDYRKAINYVKNNH